MRFYTISIMGQHTDVLENIFPHAISRTQHNIILVTCDDTSRYSSNYYNDGLSLFFRTSEACKKGFVVYPKVSTFNIAFTQDYRLDNAKIFRLFGP